MNGIAAAAIFGTYLTLLAVLLYFCVVADPESSRISHYLTITVPNMFWQLLQKHLGRDFYQAVEYVLDRALLIFYITIVYGGWIIVFVYIYPWVGRQEYLPHYHHRYIGMVWCIACIISWRLAHTVHPGLITSETLSIYDHYPYDDLLFPAGQICPTRQIPKLARSKYDRSKYHENVARFDHFCGWVHNTIGEENYRWFLLFLVVHVGVRIFVVCNCTEMNDLYLWKTNQK
jgi:palmitoyltransferase ZDHHC4